jgi:low affinity Fe/Cu permease
MLLLLYYLIAVAVLVAHFSGRLARWGLEWLTLILAVTVFPAVIYL